MLRPLMPRVFHLDCGPMRPWPAPLVNGSGRWRDAGRLVCHCLLIETDRDLILVDSGIGSKDIAEPARLGRLFRAFARPTLDPAGTAVEQIRRLGFSPADVGHIIVTHLDVDHAGGLADFPHAKVHVYDRELDAALDPQTFSERHRYRAAQFEHGVDWVRHCVHGERWRGFEGVRLAIPRAPEILLVPLHGHSRGHAAVAVQEGDEWLMHCGDAYFVRHEVRTTAVGGPLGMALFRRFAAVDNRVRRANVARLRVLAQQAPHLTMFCAHDPDEFTE